MGILWIVLKLMNCAMLLLLVDEIVELWLEWCCDMIVMINHGMGVRDSMSLFMFGVLLLGVVEFWWKWWIKLNCVFDDF